MSLTETVLLKKLRKFGAGSIQYLSMHDLKHLNRICKLNGLV